MSRTEQCPAAPSKLSVLSDPWRTFHPSVCSVAFWTHVKTHSICSVPWSKFQNWSARRMQNISFYFLPACHLLVYLTPPQSLDQRSQSLLPYSFFPGQWWFYTPLSHPPSVYLPCRQKSPSLFNPSPHGSCSIPLILPVTLLCTNSAASFEQGGDGNQARWRLTPHLRSSTLISLPVTPKSLFFCPRPPLWVDIFLEYPFQLQHFFPEERQLFLQNRGFLPTSVWNWLRGGGTSQIPGSAGKRIRDFSSKCKATPMGGKRCLRVCSGSKKRVNHRSKRLPLMDIRDTNEKKANNSM